MSRSGPLSGRTIVVTRPLAQAAALAGRIDAAGGEALVFPLLEIQPVADRQPLHRAAEQLADYALAIFISPNAVDHALPAILAHGVWPPNVQPAAVGPGTARSLSAHGVVDCLLPDQRFDSEGLLAQPALAAAQIAGRPVVIFRGDGGRELLADTLRERGARVDCVACYQRCGPAQGFAPWLAAWTAGRLDAVLLSSSEALRYLWDGLPGEGRERLCATPVFVPHARIADNARACGLRNVVLTAATDDGLMDGLLAYNWPA